MKFTNSVLISLSGILATVLVYQGLLSDNNNERHWIESTNLSYRHPQQRGLLRTADDKADKNAGAPSDESEQSYILLHALLDRYKNQHSQGRLLRELQQCKERNQSGLECPELQKRKFLVSYYSCPESAGNRLHHFMNGMIWAIVTGRTLLYDVFDNETCHSLSRASGRAKTFWCDQHGTASETANECNAALQLAPWIPSFRKWKDELGLEVPSHAYCGAGGGQAEFRDGVKADLLPDRVISACHGVMQNAGRVLLEQVMSSSPDERVVTSTDSFLTRNSSMKAARTLMRVDDSKLSAEGGLNQAWYLYGMLFNDAFKIRPHLLPAADEIVSGPDVASIAIHSRHINAANDGSDIAEERDCLRQVLKSVMEEKGVDKCPVYIMSDRLATVEGLVSESELLGCQAIKLRQHEHVNQGVLLEHGSFDKVDFIRDLALVSNAEDGLIGPGRPSTSTFLLREMMEFNRKKKGISGKIVTCPLSRRN